MRRRKKHRFLLSDRAKAYSSSFLILVGGVLAQGADLPASRHDFVVIAHRGDHESAYENTLPALEHAIIAGVDYVEIDVRRTADSNYVLMHDSTVDRMTDGHGLVADLTLAQLRSLHVRDLKRPQIPADRVPSFDEALVAIKGRINVYLDFKEGDRAAVARTIRTAGVTKQVLVYDDADSVGEWRRVAPELPLIISPPKDAKSAKTLASFVSKVGVEVLDGSWKGYSREMVEAAKRVGVRTWPDIQGPLEDAAYFEKVIAVGFTGVQTDHPEELIAWLTQQHRR